MPSIVTKFKIFLASPSDLSEDRLALNEVIDELNLGFGIQNNVHLELLKWETHSAPAVSEEHPQEVINNDIGNDYDLFIGLLWKKFGTKTDKAESGTEEEFLRAYKRFKDDPKSLQVLIYFNNSPVSPIDIEPDQISKIKKFRDDLGENKNTLYWQYQNTEQLAKFLRIHIPKRILELNKNFEARPEKIEKSPVNKGIDTLDDNLGIVDYQEIIEENLQESTLALERIAETIVWMGEQLNTKTNEINSLSLGGVQPSRKELKSIYKRTSKVFDSFATRLKPDIPIYQNNFENGIDAFSKLLNIGRTDLEFKEEEIEETKQTLITLIGQIDYGIESMNEFLSAVKSLPRLSQDLNKSKDNVSSILETLLSNMNVSRNIANELLNSI